MMEEELSFTEKVFLILVLLSSCTTVVADFGLIRYALVAMYVLLLGMKEIKLSNHKCQIIVLVGLFGIWMIQMLWYDNSGKFFYILKIYVLLFMMATYLGCYRKKNRKRLDFLYSALFFFTIASDIVYIVILLGVQLPKFVSSLELYCYYYFLQEFYDPVFGIMSYRNNGIFWEPGVNQVFLNFLLMYTVFRPQTKEKKERNWNEYFKVFIIVLSVASTGSVTGILSCAIILLVKCFEGTRGYRRLFLALFAVLAMVIVTPILVDLFVQKKETVSFEHRVGDLEIGINLFSQNPLLGRGIGDDNYPKEFYKEFGFERTNSNGIVEMILATGLLGTTLYLMSSMKTALWFERQGFRGMKYAFLSWILISLMNEPIEACAFMFFIICIGWHDDGFCKGRIKKATISLEVG